VSRDRDEGGERPRPSWREIDRRRDQAGRRAPRDAPAEAAREKAAARQARRELDALFAPGGDGRGRELARALRAAHGTPGLAAACRVYLDAAGVPEDPALLAILLDAPDRDVRLAALGALRALRDGGRLAAGPGLRSQLRLLREDADDDVAAAAEDLLA
jgi:hypothetical protein